MSKSYGATALSSMDRIEIRAGSVAYEVRNCDNDVSTQRVNAMGTSDNDVGWCPGLLVPRLNSHLSPFSLGLGWGRMHSPSKILYFINQIPTPPHEVLVLPKPTYYLFFLISDRSRELRNGERSAVVVGSLALPTSLCNWLPLLKVRVSLSYLAIPTTH